ncbi:hypothetical protein V565_296940, partial [Rhizoctonia solani 123E]
MQKDKDRGMGDKRIRSGTSQGSRRAEWGLHHHGIGQHKKHQLRPSPALRDVGGKKGIKGREEYLADRALNDGKINHITQLIHPAFYNALAAAKLRVKERSAEGEIWASQWTSQYLNQAIFENRQTALHRDSNGAPYCADFLYLLGEFKGGDLFLPDLNLRIEWLPNCALMFDGRIFAHEVLPWEGERRLCLVNYIWKTSLDDLEVELPEEAPQLAGILQRVRDQR